MGSTVCGRCGHDFDLYGRCRLCSAVKPVIESKTTATKPNDLLIVDGVKYRPLLTGEVRERGDVFTAMGRIYPELSQYLGTPQTRTEKDDFMSQSYRPL